MKASHSIRCETSCKGFTVVELIVAFLLFSMATAGILLMSKAVANHQTAAASATQRNAYATFQSQVALQGINPSVVGNPLTGAINQTGTAGTVVSLGSNTTLTVTRDRMAEFEMGATSQKVNLARSGGSGAANLAGAANVDAVNYSVVSSGTQATRGAGIGFAVETIGSQAAQTTTPLKPPAFSITGDLTNQAFPLNYVASLPTDNPAGTVYRYTTDGSTPSATSPLWDNANLNWTPSTFPAEVTLAAFNTDSQYSTSVAVTARYWMQLVITYSRADGRTVQPYGFTLADLADPATAGIVLTTNVPGFNVLYTLDGSDPTAVGVTYSGPFTPGQSNFNAVANNADLTGTGSGTATLKYVALSTDPRILSTQITGATLTSIPVPLGSPTFVTDNSQPLAPGTNVVISVSGSSAVPKTEVNNGSPTQSSSSATSFPLN